MGLENSDGVNFVASVSGSLSVCLRDESGEVKISRILPCGEVACITVALSEIDELCELLFRVSDSHMTGPGSYVPPDYSWKDAQREDYSWKDAQPEDYSWKDAQPEDYSWKDAQPEDYSWKDAGESDTPSP